MLDFNLPLGKRASLFPEKEINYNISGLFICTELIFKLITIIEDKFEYRLPIKYIFGSPSVKWNGGRYILKDMNKLESLEFIEKEILYSTFYQELNKEVFELIKDLNLN